MKTYRDLYSIPIFNSVYVLFFKPSKELCLLINEDSQEIIEEYEYFKGDSTIMVEQDAVDFLQDLLHEQNPTAWNKAVLFSNRLDYYYEIYPESFLTYETRE